MLSKGYLSWTLPEENIPSPSSCLWCFSQASSFFPRAFYPFTMIPPISFKQTQLSMLSPLMWNYYPTTVPFTCLAHQNWLNPYRTPSMLPALSSLKPSTSLMSHHVLAHFGITPWSSKDAVSPLHLQISLQKVFGSQEKAACQSTAWSQTRVRTVSLTFSLALG